MPFAPLLKITDGTIGVHLVGTSTIIKLQSWQPARSQDRTAWRSAPLLDGRSPISHNMENAIEQLKLSVQAANQDLLIETVQNLEMLLTKARDYWLSDWGKEPVWIEARSPGETNTRYAVIVDFQLANDNNLYASPFFLCEDGAGYLDWGLTLEHGLWQDQPPGGQTCVQQSTVHTYPMAYDEIVEVIQASNDDVVVDVATATITKNGVNLPMGGKAATGTSLHAGLHFDNITIPQNAVIISAWLRFISDTDQAGAACNLRIWTEDPTWGCTDYAADTYAQFIGRSANFKTQYVDWTVPAWTAGVAYDSADIKTLVQAVVNDAQWASGADMNFQLRNNTSGVGAYREPSALDHAADNPPELHIQYAVIDGLASGWTADCLLQPIANKHTDSQLTHVFYYDDSAGTFSGNLLGTALPQTLLPAVVAVNDCIYFGIASGLPGSGPFDNLVVNLSLGGSYATYVWEHQTAAFPAAPAYTAYVDNADVKDSTLGLTVPGFGTVFFYPRVLWLQNTVNGIYGWWIRLRVTNAGLGAPPVQSTRQIYSSIWNYVDIDDSAVPGTLPALLKLGMSNLSGHLNSPQPNLYWNTISWYMVGLRSNSRGVNFRSTLNCSSDNLPDNVTIALGTATTELTGRATSITGHWTYYVSAGVEAMAMRTRWTFNVSVTKEWEGVYHAFLRSGVVPGGGAADGDMRVRLAISSSPAAIVYWTGPSVGINLARADFADTIVDLGPVVLWPVMTNDTEYSGTINLDIQAECVAAGVRGLAIQDLILIPADEWSAKVWAGPTSLELYGEGVIAGTGYLAIDSISVPKNPFRGAVVTGLGMTNAIYPARAIMPREAILQARTDQRLHFLAGHDYLNEAYAPTMLNGPFSYRLSRYHLLRGNK